MAKGRSARKTHASGVLRAGRPRSQDALSQSRGRPWVPAMPGRGEGHDGPGRTAAWRRPCSATRRPAPFCRYPVTRLYCNDLANAWPRLAFEVCAPAQNGTAISAKVLCESQTSLKKAFSAAFFSSEALAAFM